MYKNKDLVKYKYALLYWRIKFVEYFANAGDQNHECSGEKEWLLYKGELGGFVDREHIQGWRIFKAGIFFKWRTSK